MLARSYHCHGCHWPSERIRAPDPHLATDASSPACSLSGKKAVRSD
jgi:hypothetical protein